MPNLITFTIVSMNRFLLLILSCVFVLFTLTVAEAQPCDIPPSTEDCVSAPILCDVDDINGYCTSMSPNMTFNGPSPLCAQGGAPHNTSWFAFYAGCSQLQITVTPSNCTPVGGQLGVQAMIYFYGGDGLCPGSNQQPQQVIACQSIPCFTSPWTLTANLTIGQIYYFLLDGCAGSYCDIQITTSPCGPPAINDWPGAISGPLTICSGATANYTVPQPTGAVEYHWFLDGTEIQVGPTNTVAVQWTQAGTYELCVDASNQCVPVSDFPQETCITVEVYDITPEDPEPRLICEDKTTPYNGLQYAPGVYTINIPTAQGCDSIVTLTVLPDPNVDEDLGLVYLCPNDIVVIGGVQWDYSNQGQQSYTINKSYSVYNGDFCDSTINFEIMGLYVDVFIFPPLDLGCDFPQVELIGSNSVYGPDGTVIWQWQAFQGGVLGSPSDGPDMTITEPGKYCLRLEIISPDGSTSCWDSTCVVVQQFDIPDVGALQPQPITCANPIVTLTGTSSTPNTIGEWRGPNWEFLPPTDPPKNFMAEASQPGLYTFIVTDELDCTSEYVVLVEDHRAYPDVLANGDTLTCVNDPAILTGFSGTPGVTYTWKDSNGNPIGNPPNNPNFPAPGPGTYTLVVNNPTNGCRDSATAVIAVNQVPPIPTASADILTCSTPNPPLLGGSNVPNATYRWTFGGNTYSTQRDTVAGQSGSYTLIVTNPSNGCTADTTIIVEENTVQPNAQAEGDSIDCVKTIATLVGSSGDPGVTYQWLDPTNNPIGNTPSIDVNNPGIYTLIVTGLNGCTRSVTAAVTQNVDIPDLNITATDDTITCLVENITLAASSNLTVTYQWNTGASTPNINVTSAGTYCVTVTSGNGCSNEMCYVIEEDLAQPVIVSTTGGVIDCIVDCINLNAISSTPNVTYQWRTPGGSNLPPGPNPCVNIPGLYTLIVTAPNGCTATETALVETSPDAPQDVSTSVSGPLTCVVSQVSISVTSSTPGVTYFWSGPAVPPGSETQQSLNVTLDGTYFVTVTNSSNGCTVQSDITVVQDTVSPVLTPTGGLITCTETQDQISVASVPSTGISWAWFDPSGNPFGGSTPQITVTEPGNWNVVVTNSSNGCTSSSNVFVDEDRDFPDLALLTAARITCDNPTSTISAISTTPGVEYQWSGPGINPGNQNISNPEVTLPGDYTVVVTNPVNGCSRSESITVIEDTTFPVISMQGFTIDCTTPSAPLTATVTPASGTAITWTRNGEPYPGNTSTINITEDGVYQITVRNTDNGCVTSAEATIVEDFAQPNIQVSGTELTCIDLTGPVSGSSTTPGVTYFWSGPGIPPGQENNPGFQVSIPGNYVLVVTAPNGCTDQATAVVTEDKDLPTAVASSSNIIDCTNETTTLSSAGSSTGTSFNYAWSFGGNFLGSNSSLPGVSQPGVYTLRVTNTENGCFSETSVVVQENQNLPTGIEVDLQNPRCFGYKDGIIVVTSVIGGTPDYLYSLNGGPFTPSPQFTGLGEGSFTITIQDAAGCLYTAPPFQLTQPLQLTVDLGDDFILQWGRDTFIYALISPPNAIIESINWTPTGVDTTGNSREIQIKPFNQTLYGIVVTDAAGCRAEDKVLVLVEKRRPVYIPNAFNPTGDQNTRFYIQAGDGIEEIEVFEVFNRWGERVFKRENFLPNDPSQGWDGTFNSRILDPQVLVYYAKIRFNDGITLLYKGDVTLLR